MRKNRTLHRTRRDCGALTWKRGDRTYLRWWTICHWRKEGILGQGSWGNSSDKAEKVVPAGHSGSCKAGLVSHGSFLLQLCLLNSLTWPGRKKRWPIPRWDAIFHSQVRYVYSWGKRWVPLSSLGKEKETNICGALTAGRIHLALTFLFILTMDIMPILQMQQLTQRLRDLSSTPSYKMVEPGFICCTCCQWTNLLIQGLSLNCLLLEGWAKL